MVAAAIAFYGCKKKSSDTEESLLLDSLVIQYQSLNDSVDSNWDIMIADDDDKHVLMNRLLLEVSYTNNFDKSIYEELSGLVKKLPQIRYDRKSMKDSDLIDEYDSATWGLTDQLIQFARNHPRYDDTPMMEELIDDINAKNNFVLMHRIHFDNWAKELNAFMDANDNTLKKAEPPVKLERLPLFQLPL